MRKLILPFAVLICISIFSSAPSRWMHFKSSLSSILISKMRVIKRGVKRDLDALP